MNIDIDEIRRWLRTLHSSSEGFIWVGSTENMAGYTATDIDDVISNIEALERVKPKGIYVRTTTLSRIPLTPNGDGSNRRSRGTETDSYTLPGFAADLDIAGPGHKTTKLLPPDEATAMSIVTESGLPVPTLWVHSGGGLYPWWLLNDPQDIRDPEALARAKALSEKIQKILVVNGDRLGWHVGGEVGDMARILRVPGTVNRKDGLERPCRIIEDSITYDHFHYGELEALVEGIHANLPKPELPTYTPRVTAPGTGLSPLDDWEAKSDWTDIPNWPFELVDVHSYERRWLRIGSASGARWSATTGHATDRDRLYCWTPETVFEARKPYNKQAAYVLLTQGSLSSAAFAQATRELRAQGFGGELPKFDRATDVVSLVRPAAQVPVAVQPVDDQQPTQAVTVVEANQALAVETHTELPEIDLGSEQEAIVEIARVVNSGKIPHIYIKDGQLVHVHAKSNTDCAEVTVVPVTADLLNFLLAHHVRTYRWVSGAPGKPPVRKACAPMMSALRAVASSAYWPGVKPLNGVIGAPTLRPDGTLIQDCGYDEVTGLYLSPVVQLARVPEQISDEQVRVSREFVFGKVFGEFCWSTPGDFANYMSLLVSPMMRPYIKTTTPFGLITATTAGSGKTNLSDAIGMIYGQSSQTWPARAEELQKKITSILVGSSNPVVVFDNLTEGTSIRSAIIAGLITKSGWDDRMLGHSRNVEATNDRLWLATGNGLTVGGDMATRTVMVRLDPRMEKPQLREFEMGQFSDWILDPKNRSDLLYHLLVLVQAWMKGGAPTDPSHMMRGFTRWAQIMGGLLAFHGLRDFLTNTDDLESRDTDQEEWASFLRKWHEIYGTARKSSKEIQASAQVDFIAGVVMDRWSGYFISDEEGRTPTTKKLSMMLFGHRDRMFGPLVLRSVRNTSTNSTEWWVEKGEEDDKGTVRDVAAQAGTQERPGGGPGQRLPGLG